MHKQLRAALAVEIVVLIIALGFSVAYVRFGLYRSSHILDVMLVVLWVLVAAVALMVFRSRSLQREELVRRFFISDDWIYNYEIGYAPLSTIVPDRDPFEFASFAAESLALMSYGFEVADPPTDFQPKYLISSTKFRFHLIDGETEGDDVGAVVDEWAGTLQKLEEKEDGTHRRIDLGSYSNVKELARLLDANGVMVSSYSEGLFAGSVPDQPEEGEWHSQALGSSPEDIFDDDLFCPASSAPEAAAHSDGPIPATEGGASE